MKHNLLIGLMMVATSLIAACEKDTLITEKRLPEVAQTFLDTYFANDPVLYVISEYEVGEHRYEVILESGADLEFYKSGEWKQVECHTVAVPEGIVPEVINTYLTTQFPEAFVTGIEKDRTYFDVELSNRLELTFNSAGKVVEVDD